MFLTEATDNLVVTSRGPQEGSTQVLDHRYKQLYLSGETSVQTFGCGARPDVHTCWPPSFNNDTLRHLWMQLRALLRLVFCTCCMSMDAASCFASSRAPRLLSTHGCSIVLRAYCHAHGYSFVLRARRDQLHLRPLATPAHETLAT
jgi:hypothetical protein